MGKTVALIKAQAVMYKALVRVVIIYGIEIWLLPDTMMKVLESIRHSIERRIAWMTS